MDNISTYEKCKAIRDVILITASEIMNYQSWNAEFGKKELLSISDDKRLLGIDPYDLTEDQMINLGFKRWSKDTELMLIPLWLFKFLADDVNVECIDGTKVDKKSEMDNDNRLGCLAYGVVPKDKQ